MTRSAVFDRIVCGIDGTPESLEAVRQAVAMAPPHAALHLFHAPDLGPALSVAWAAPELAPAMSVEASGAHDAAAALAPGATTNQVAGPATTGLLEELERVDATLVAVGSHGVTRAEGILLGTTATRMPHDAPCPVLVARSPGDSLAMRRFLVGVDGSPQSELAARAAFDVAERLGAPVFGLTALSGNDVHLDAARCSSSGRGASDGEGR